MKHRPQHISTPSNRRIALNLERSLVELILPLPPTPNKIDIKVSLNACTSRTLMGKPASEHDIGIYDEITIPIKCKIVQARGVRLLEPKAWNESNGMWVGRDIILALPASQPILLSSIFFGYDILLVHHAIILLNKLSSFRCTLWYYVTFLDDIGCRRVKSSQFIYFHLHFFLEIAWLISIFTLFAA